MTNIVNKKFILFVLLLTCFLDWMSIGLVYPMFSSMVFHPEAHFFPLETPSVIRGIWLGVLLAASPLAQFLSSPIVGMISDQKGRKPLIEKSLFVIIAGYLLCAVSVWLENLYLLLFARLIVGLGTGNVAAVYAAIADVSKPEEKAKHFGLASMACGIGFTLGPFLGGTLCCYGFATPFLFAGFFSLCNLLLLFFGFKETHHHKKQVHWNLTMGFKNLRKALHTPTFRALFLCFFFFCVGWSFYWEFIPVNWIKQHNLNPSQVGNFYAYGAIFYALSSGLLIRPIVSKFKPLPILFFALTLLALSIFPLLLHSKVDIFWFYIPIQQFLTALVFPTGTTAISNSVDESSQGEYLGMLQSVDSFAFAATPVLAGAFVGLTPNSPVLVSGTFMLLASFTLLNTYRKKLFQ